MRASLGGVTLAAQGEVQWVKRPGFVPSTMDVYLPLGTLASIIPKNGEIELVLGDRVIKKLFILATGPGDGAVGNEKSAEFIRVGDSRYALLTRTVQAAVNLRRVIATGVLNPNSSQPVQVRTPNFLEEYYPQTLKDGLTPYTVKDLIIEFLEEANIPFAKPPKEFPDGDILGQAGFQITGPVSEVCQQLLDSVAGWGFDVDDNGQGYFFKVNELQLSLEVVDEVGKYGSVFGGGVPGILDRSYMRPREIRVHYPARVEMGLGYRPSQDRIFAVTLPAPRPKGYVPPRFLESYINNPVQALDYLGNKLARGAMLNFHAFLIALRDMERSGEIRPPDGAKAQTRGSITEDLIREFYLRPTNVQDYSTDIVGGANQLYLDIFYEIFRSYRMKYRLSYEWAPFVLAISAKRVAYLDPITRVRVDASAWCDFTGIPGERLVSSRKRDHSDNNRYLEYRYSASTFASLDDEASVRAPAFVRVTDQQTKAFEIVFRHGQFGDINGYGPFTLEEPVLNLNIGNLKSQLGYGGTISDVFAMDTILTLTPVPRRSGNHLHTITVKPSEVQALLVGKSAKTQSKSVPTNGMDRCYGPVLDIFMPEDEMTTAFFKFAEQDAAQLAAPFFDESSRFPVSALVNEPQLISIAKAYAASAYANLLDVMVGGNTVPTSDQNFNFKGNYNLSVASPSTTIVRFGPYEANPNPLNFMPLGLRQQFLQRIQQ